MGRQSGLQTPLTISIIIPILNEAKILDKTLSQLQPELGHHELIIVDGGSTDNSTRIAEKYGEVVTSARGRAKQLNAGAAAATGDILLFYMRIFGLNRERWWQWKQHSHRATSVGGFRQKIDGKRILYRMIEIAGNIRGKYLKVFYGDSGIFLARADFEKIGGFPDLPILEEMEFSKGLRKLGKTTLIVPHIHLSARRWEARGIIRTTLNNWLITLLYFLKVSPERLAKLYRHIR